MNGGGDTIEIELVTIDGKNASLANHIGEHRRSRARRFIMCEDGLACDVIRELGEQRRAAAQQKTSRLTELVNIFDRFSK